MALETYYTYSADTLKAELTAGTGALATTPLRHFMFGAMDTRLESTTPQWVTTQNSLAAGPQYRWHTAQQSAAAPSLDPQSNAHSAWARFSSTCMYFGAELILARRGGPDATVPVGLIQSARGGSQIESWM